MPVHITSNVVNLNPADGEVYSIQHYVIEFVSDLRQVFCFLQVLQFPLQIPATWSLWTSAALATTSLDFTPPPILQTHPVSDYQWKAN
jgi:hypothetical protein